MKTGRKEKREEGKRGGEDRLEEGRRREEKVAKETDESGQNKM